MKIPYIKIREILWLFLLFVPVYSSFAQSSPETPPVINAENTHLLQSIIQIDFENFDSDFNSGWFVMNESVSLFAVRTIYQAVWILDRDAQRIADPIAMTDEDGFPVQIIDAAFAQDGITVLLNDGHQTCLIHDALDEDNPQRSTNCLDIDGIALALWKDCPEETIDCDTWLEMLPVSFDEPPMIVQVSSTGEIISRHPSAPSQDNTAQVRVGRVPLPYVVTSSADGLIKLWNLQSDEIQSSYRHTELVPFGNINHDATRLLWRDVDNEKLQLLDFSAEVNAVIADLGGQYAQWLLLTPEADVAFAINMGFDPIVIAWDVMGGAELLRYPYRTCERIPDMVRLSHDGTSIVIGCESGLELWQIVAD